ncbi:hypothetical protein FRC03_006414 [Tulasnella sp. 419]|nr:hypothetical protein FRC03_006414 [Tulasnella sp. 419]
MAKVSSNIRPRVSFNKKQDRGGNGVPSGSRVRNGRKRNAIGYAKRQERKNKNKIGLSDIYEYAEEGSSKRSKVEMGFTREELADMGRVASGSEDGDGDDDKIARLGGNMNEDAMVLSEDDEEIESDDAFEGESDEERFSGFKFAEKAKTKPKGTQSKHVNLNEDDSRSQSSHNEDEDEDEDDEEAGDDGDVHHVDGLMDLSELLNRGPSPIEESVDESEDEDEDNDVLAPSDDEGGESTALDSLGSFIGGLSQKRKASDDANEGRRKRRILSERTEAGPEGEFTGPAPASKLRVEDLLAPLASSGTNPSSLITLKKSVKALSTSNSGSGTLSAPLPTRTQERIDREAAYEQTREEVKKWAPSMERIRNAEHLSFPLQVSTGPKPSTSDLAAKFKPSNALESAVDNLLKAANLREQDVTKTEELQMKDLTVEEVQARRAELRYSRELMFRAEVKAKRIAKIKSKTYRKIHRKLKEKNQLSAEDLETLDPEAADAERMKAEVDRARERASLRHKNGGKWVKNMKGVEGDLEKRQDLAEMLQRGEVLRKKIAGDTHSSDEDEQEDGDIDAIKARAFEELAAFDDDEGGETSAHQSGIFEMKFMKEAMARKLAKVNEVADDFRKELMGGEANSDVEDAAPSTQPSFIMVGGNKGRVIFQPNGFDAQKSAMPNAMSPKPLLSAASDTSSVTLKSSDYGVSHRYSPPMTLGALQESALNEENPWLTLDGDAPSSKVARKTTDVVISKDSSFAAKSKNALKKQQQKGHEARTREQEDAIVEINLDNVLTVAGKEAPEKSRAKGVKNSMVDSAYEEKDDEDSIQNPKALRQRDLVALAFAGDNVVEEFEVAKRKEVESDAPRELDTTIPGWGSWTGPGTKKQVPNPKLVKKIAGVEPTRRADYNKSHVIISEKKDKKASKYQVKDLPYPFTSIAQYERSLEVPLGPEWNTRTGFQKATLPRVVKKMGTVITPVEKLF